LGDGFDPTAQSAGFGHSYHTQGNFDFSHDDFQNNLTLGETNGH
jgi:hypothetical protein